MTLGLQILFVAECDAGRERIAPLLPRSTVVHSMEIRSDLPSFPVQPVMVLAQDKDRCVNRALMTAEYFVRSCPVLVYGHNFDRHREQDLGIRGVAGLILLSWSDTFIRLALSSICERTDPPIKNLGGCDPLRNVQTV